MRKQYFVLLLIGLIAVAGVMFTGCPPEPSTWRFENHTTYAIQVESQDLDPSYFVLKAYTGTAEQLLLPGVGDNPAVDSLSATSTKSKPSFGYICQGQNAVFTESNVKMRQSGSVIRFEKNDDQGLAKIKLAEEE